MWDFDIVVTWQIKNVISTLSQGLWILHLDSSWFKTREPTPTKPRSTSIAWLGDKSKTFYFHIHKAYGPQNLVWCWLRMRVPHPKSHVTLQLCGQMENKKRHIFSTTGPRCKKKACARQKQTQKCQLELGMLRWSRSWVIWEFICITASVNPVALKLEEAATGGVQ